MAKQWGPRVPTSPQVLAPGHVSGPTTGGCSGRWQTRGPEVTAASQLLGHWCEVMQFLQDDVGRVLDTNKTTPLSLIEVLEKKLNCSG